MPIYKILYNNLPYNIKVFIRGLGFFLKNPLIHIDVCFNYIFHNKDVFKSNITITAIIKNEAEYIKEWLEYHKIIGVNKFIIYDNNSNDNVKEILFPYIKSGDVEYIFYPRTQAEFEKKNKKTEYWAFQAYAYNDAIKKYRNKTKWIGFIDIDEFIVPVKNDNLADIMVDINNTMQSKKKLFVGLAINWVMYGFSGHRQKPGGLVTENFKKNEGIQRQYKSIVNPRTVIKYLVHAALHFFHIEVVNERCIDAFISDVSRSSIELIRINHYYTKSYEEYEQKIIKSKAGWPGADKYNLPEYDPDYLSSFEDNVIDRFIPILKQRLSNT